MVLKGEKLSEEHKRKISEALKGKPKPWQKDKRMSEQTCLKMKKDAKQALLKAVSNK